MAWGCQQWISVPRICDYYSTSIVWLRPCQNRTVGLGWRRRWLHDIPVIARQRVTRLVCQARAPCPLSNPNQFILPTASFIFLSVHDQVSQEWRPVIGKMPLRACYCTYHCDSCGISPAVSTRANGITVPVVRTLIISTSRRAIICSELYSFFEELREDPVLYT